MNQNHASFGKEILPKCLFVIAVLLFTAFFIAPVAAEESLSLDKTEILLGETVTASIIGEPNSQFTIYYDSACLDNADNRGTVTINLDNEGKGTVLFKGIGVGTTIFYFIASDGRVHSFSVQVKDGSIYLTQFPTVVNTGDTYTIQGTATATEKVRYYIFGDAYFKQGEVTLSGNTFTITETAADKIGDFYVVIQHPLSDNTFNITIDNTPQSPDSPRYSVWRQDAYGSSQVGSVYTLAPGESLARDFCNLLDRYAHNEDKYVKLSFKIEKPPLTNPLIINPLPTSISHGDILQVSGNTGVQEIKKVTVDILPEWALAQPIETLPSNQHIRYIVNTDSDGIWRVNIDTAGLALGEYVVTAKVESVGSAESSAVGIWQQPTEQPTEVPTQTPGEQPPVRPTEPPLDPVTPIPPAELQSIYILPPQGNYQDITVSSSVLVTGEPVSGSFIMRMPGGRESGLRFSSILESTTWQISVFEGNVEKDAQNPIITVTGTSEPNQPFEPSTYSLEYNSQTTFVVSFSGTVPEMREGYVSGTVSLFNINSAKIGSYRSPEQMRYNTNYLDSQLDRYSNFLTNHEEIFNKYAERGYSLSSARKPLTDARNGLAYAKQAAESNEIIKAFETLDVIDPLVDKIDRILSDEGLWEISHNTLRIRSYIDSLYERGWNTEALYLEVKLNSIEDEYDSYYEQYNQGHAHLSSSVDYLLTKSIELRQTAESYIGGNTAPLPTTITLRTGWNVISTPKYLDTSCDTAGELLQEINSGGVSPMGYDAKTKKWYTLDKTTPIKPLDCYWIYTTEPMTLTLNYLATPNSPSVKEVYVGWNAVGLSAENTLTAEEAFNNIAWVEYLAWDIASGKWNTVIIKGISGDKFVKPVDGGWLYVEENGIYRGKTA